MMYLAMMSNGFLGKNHLELFFMNKIVKSGIYTDLGPHNWGPSLQRLWTTICVSET